MLSARAMLSMRATLSRRSVAVSTTATGSRRMAALSVRVRAGGWLAIRDESGVTIAGAGERK
jgi:hypothetical protein